MSNFGLLGAPSSAQKGIVVKMINRYKPPTCFWFHMKGLRAYALHPNQNYLKIPIFGQFMVPWGGPGSPQCPPNGTNSKDDQPLECLSHIWFNMSELMGCRRCKMSDLFKNSYFLVHFCSLLGILYCPRSLSSGLSFKLMKGLNPHYNHMLSRAGFRRYDKFN